MFGLTNHWNNELSLHQAAVAGPFAEVEMSQIYQGPWAPGIEKLRALNCLFRSSIGVWDLLSISATIAQICNVYNCAILLLFSE